MIILYFLFNHKILPAQVQYGYFKKLPEKELPDTLEEMEPLYMAVRHGCMAGQYEEALDYVYWERIRRKEQGYSIYRLGAFGADLTALSHFFSDIWSVPVAELPDEKKIFVMNRSGYCLRATGRLQEGKILLDLSLKEYTKQENWAEMTQAATNLSILHLLLADLITADNYARNSLEYAQKTKDWFWIGTASSALAAILHAFGYRSEAKKYFLQLESDLKKQNPERTFLYSGPGYRICDLLMDFGLYEDIIIRTEWSLKLYANSPELFYSLAGLALSHVSMGRALLHKNIQSDVSDFSKISEHLETAIVLQRKSGYQEDLPIGLFARAELNRISGNFDKARTDLNEACEIAEYGGMKLYLTDYHLEACRLCFAEGKARQAEKHLDAARKLIEETGYKRRWKDVEEIMRENVVSEKAGK